MMKKNTPPKRPPVPVVEPVVLPWYSPKKPWLWLGIVGVIAVALTIILCALFITPPFSISDPLDECVTATLRMVHQSSHTDGKYPAVTYTALGVDETETSVTVYGVMMYREYTYTTRDEVKAWGSAHYPFAITADKNADGTYTATDCWWPKDGKEYVSSIKEKFPLYCERDALDVSQYFSAHEAACLSALRQSVTDADKYVVLRSELDTVRLAYCAKAQTAYILFSGGYATDGTYAVEGDQWTFTFGNRIAAFTADGADLLFDAAASKDLPTEWSEAGSTTYLVDKTRFVLEGDDTPTIQENTAPVGATVTISSSTHMSETELREMFGQYVPSTYFESVTPKYLPTRPIESRSQLDGFLSTYADSWNGLTAENFAQFDDTFFEDNYLLMTYYRDGMAASEPTVSRYVYVQDGTSLWLSVRLQVTRPAVGDTVVGQWVLFSAIAKTDYKQATGLEAYVEKTITEEATTDLTLTGKVKEVDGAAMLLECEGNTQFSTVWVELGNVEVHPMVGETYIVTYEDIVMPSLPPRITAVTVTKP